MSAVYPEGWQHVEVGPGTQGFVLDLPGHGPAGYIAYDPEQNYISDLAVLPGTSSMSTARLILTMVARVKELNTQRGPNQIWSADLRRSTSYQFDWFKSSPRLELCVYL